MKIWLLLVTVLILLIAGNANAGPNAGATVTIDYESNPAAANRIDDGTLSATIDGEGTNFRIEVFVDPVAGPIIGGTMTFNIDTNKVRVTGSDAPSPLFPFGSTTNSATMGGVPGFAQLTVSNKYYGAAEFVTVSDVTGVGFTIGVTSITVIDAGSGAPVDTLTASSVILVNGGGTPGSSPDPQPPVVTPTSSVSLDLDLVDGNQGRRKISTIPGETISIDLVASSFENSQGPEIVFQYDPVQLEFLEFTSSLFPIDIASQSGNTVTISAITFGAAQSGENKSIGNANFKVLDGFTEETSVQLISIDFGGGSTTLVQPGENEVTFSLEPIGLIALSTRSLSYGEVPVGQSTTLSVAVSNQGNADLTVTNIATDNSQFTFTTASLTQLPFSIAPGQSIQLLIFYSPSSLGTHEARLTL